MNQLEEIQNQFEQEFDYNEEGLNLDEAYENSKDWQNEITIPRSFLDLTSRNVLVMEFLEGNVYSFLKVMILRRHDKTRHESVLKFVC